MAISSEKRRRIRATIEAEALTYQWLLYRLEKDCGIIISKSQLSQLLSGAREMSMYATYSGEQIIDSALEILNMYTARYAVS